MRVFLKEKIRPLKFLFLPSTFPKYLLSVVALAFAASFQLWAEREGELLSKGRLPLLTVASEQGKIPVRSPIRSMDVNQLTFKELTALPGIGEKLAREILNDQETRGPFRKPSDLLRVKGIGPGRLKGIAPYLHFKSDDD